MLTLITRVKINAFNVKPEFAVSVGACIFKALCIPNASCIFSVLQIFVITSADYFVRTVIEVFFIISAV